MSPREKYQRKAVAAVRVAETLRDPAERVHLLEIAGGYMALAKHAAEHRYDGPAQRVERDPANYLHDA